MVYANKDLASNQIRLHALHIILPPLRNRREMLTYLVYYSLKSKYPFHSFVNLVVSVERITKAVETMQTKFSALK